MSPLFTIFSETKVGKDEVLKDNTEKIIEDDISTEDSEKRFYSEGEDRNENLFIQCTNWDVQQHPLCNQKPNSNSGLMHSID